MIGDVVGKPGRRAVAKVLPGLREDEGIDLVIANGENAAGGRGLTPETAEELLQAGIHVITSGNHIFRQKEIMSYMEGDVPILRPLNYPRGVPGRGCLLYQVKDGFQVLVVNLMGRVNLLNVDDPFARMDAVLSDINDLPRVIIVDFHAETTSEKQALAWHLDGRVSAVLGTHTHVPTADARILKRGTAYVTDVGMVGPYNSILGDRVEPIIQHFMTGIPGRFEVADGPVVFNSVIVDIDVETGHALSIRRWDRLIAE